MALIATGMATKMQTVPAISQRSARSGKDGNPKAIHFSVSYICWLLAINCIQLSNMIFSLICLLREGMCALLDTTTQDDNQDGNHDFRSNYCPIKNLFELNENLDYNDPYISY